MLLCSSLFYSVLCCWAARCCPVLILPGFDYSVLSVLLYRQVQNTGHRLGNPHLTLTLILLCDLLPVFCTYHCSILLFSGSFSSDLSWREVKLKNLDFLHFLGAIWIMYFRQYMSQGKMRLVSSHTLTYSVILHHWPLIAPTGILECPWKRVP